MLPKRESRYWFMNVGEGANPRRDQPDEGRSWEDCVKYGFMAMGGGDSWINQSRKPSTGDYVFAYLNKLGYVGFGEVVVEAKPFKDFVPNGEQTTLLQLDLTADVQRDRMLNPATWDMCIGIHWIKTFERNSAVCQKLFRQPAIQPVLPGATLTELLRVFQCRSDGQ